MPEGGEPRARRFFGELLGLREVPKPSQLSSSGCWFEGDGLNLHLGVDPDFRPAKKAHPAFLVEDAKAVRARLEIAGVSTEDDKPLAGHDRFFAHDPFGNRLEFTQWL